MPIVDYRCPKGHVESHFVPASQCGNDHPETEFSHCSKCRRKSDRIYDLGTSSTTVGFTDKSGKSIILHFNPKTGEYQVPGQRDDELPGRGWKRISVTSMKQYEKVRKAMEEQELETVHIKQAIEREYFDTTYREHRQATRERVENAIRKGGHYVQETDDKGITRTRWAPITPRARQLFDEACKRADQHRAETRKRRESGSPNVHSRLLEHRESERSVVDGAAKRPNLPNLKELMERFKRG